MTSTTTNPAADLPDQETSVYLFDDWFDPIEAGVRDRVRGFIETMIRTELDTVLARPRYARQPAANHGSDAGVAGHRHGSRTRTLTGKFGATEIAVPRAPGSMPVMARGASGRVRHCAPISAGRKPPTPLLPRPIWPAPIRAACAAHWRQCSAARSARIP